MTTNLPSYFVSCRTILLLLRVWSSELRMWHSTANVVLLPLTVHMSCRERTWLRASRMFVGIDMSHSSSQSLYERQAGIPPSEPTVVGVSFFFVRKGWPVEGLPNPAAMSMYMEGVH